MLTPIQPLEGCWGPGVSRAGPSSWLGPRVPGLLCNQEAQGSARQCIRAVSSMLQPAHTSLSDPWHCTHGPQLGSLPVRGSSRQGQESVKKVGNMGRERKKRYFWVSSSVLREPPGSETKFFSTWNGCLKTSPTSSLLSGGYRAIARQPLKPAIFFLLICSDPERNGAHCRAISCSVRIAPKPMFHPPTPQLRTKTQLQHLPYPLSLEGVSFPCS